jgi:serine/threonine protein kinase
VDVYKDRKQIGDGTFGCVYLATSPQNEKVALKMIKKESKEGFPITSVREIKLLRILGDLGTGKDDNNNIVKLIDVVSSNTKGSDGDVYMVFEFCDHDLTGLLEAPEVKFSDVQVKYYLYKVLSALAFCHKNNILHRDVKGANILVSNKGDVKLADFGLARATRKWGNYTNRVVTLW